MDRFTKIMLALIVCLLAVIAYQPPLHEPAVLAAPTPAPTHVTRYVYKLDLLNPSCGFDWNEVQKDLNDGYEIMNLAGGAIGPGDCQNHWAVLLRKAQ